MAVSFGEQIHALTGFDGDSASASVIGENFDDVTAEWMNIAVREIINLLPLNLKAKCATRSTLNNSALTLDLDSKGEILHVVRLSADSGGYQKACREIPGIHGDLANDSSNLMFYATATDPVYWITNDSSGNPTLFVKPSPTANQPAYVHHISYPVFDADGSGTNINIKTSTSIANFPDEAEYLVVLKAAITAAEYMMLTEEDAEVYGPQLATLKQDYQQSIQVLLGVPKAQPGGGR